MFEDTDFVLAIKNTLTFTVAIVTIRNILALFLAIVLTQGLKTTTYLRTVFYIPPVLSYVVVGIMFTAIFQMNGTFNQILDFLRLPAKDRVDRKPRHRAFDRHHRGRVEVDRLPYGDLHRRADCHPAGLLRGVPD